MENAALDKNEYEMPKVNIGNLAYESKVTKHVLNMIRPLHPESKHLSKNICDYISLDNT